MLESQEAEEGASVTLRCELSKPGVPVEWKKGMHVLKSGKKYQMKQKAFVNELLIKNLVPEDSGDYSCVCGDQKTTGNLNIKGMKRIFKELVHGRFLENFIEHIFMCLFRHVCFGISHSVCTATCQCLLFVFSM